MTIRILIVDDHSIVRTGLRTVLRRDPELHVVDEAADGAAAIEKARRLRPDVVLMDLMLPGIDGIAATTTICSEMPETEVIILTSALESGPVAKAIRAGASGYLLKDAHPGELREEIKAAAAGQVHLSPQAAASLLHELCAPESPELLTEPEMDVLRLLVRGYSNRELAEALHISEETVKTHVRHILTKLKVESRTQAILAARNLGLVARDF